MNDDSLDATSFKIIKEMSTEELMEEIVRDYRGELFKETLEDLRHRIVHIRRAKLTDRLMREAGFDPEDPPCEQRGFRIFGG